MHYQISRNGQMYGPYTFEDLQRYVASGNVLGTDLAKNETMANWVPVAQILAGADAAAPPPPVYPTPPTQPYGTPSFGGMATQPQVAGDAAYYPDAPNLHWGLVLLIGIFCGIFLPIWDLVTCAWLKSVQPNATALYFYIVSDVLGVVCYICLVASGFHKSEPNGALAVLAFLIAIAWFAMTTVARFSQRASLQEHFNTVEPMGLRLSGVMTFFFAPYYFQYHLNRINEMKKVARYASGSVRPY